MSFVAYTGATNLAKPKLGMFHRAASEGLMMTGGLVFKVAHSHGCQIGIGCKQEALAPLHLCLSSVLTTWYLLFPRASNPREQGRSPRGL